MKYRRALQNLRGLYHIENAIDILTKITKDVEEKAQSQILCDG